MRLGPVLPPPGLLAHYISKWMQMVIAETCYCCSVLLKLLLFGVSVYFWNGFNKLYVVFPRRCFLTFINSLCSCCSTPHTCYETKLDLRLHAEQKRLHSKEGNGEKKFKIHCVSRSSRQSGTFRATWNDQTHKYCLLWDWWKTNSQLKSSLLLLSLLLLTPRCLCALSVIHRTA